MKNKLLLTTSLIIIIIAIAVSTAGLLSDQKTIHNGGSVTSSVGVEVYNDPATTNSCTTINWGSLYPGDSATKTIYIKNTGNTNETLHLITSDWNPSQAGSLISLNWNKEATQLQPSGIVAATLTLTTQGDMGDLTDFEFNVTIQGTA